MDLQSCRGGRGRFKRSRMGGRRFGGVRSRFNRSRRGGRRCGGVRS